MPNCRFCVLVAGTLIYGRGDEVEEKIIMEELATEEAAEEVVAPPAIGAQPVTSGRPSRSVSIGRSASGASRPIMMGTPSSMKVRQHLTDYFSCCILDKQGS